MRPKLDVTVVDAPDTVGMHESPAAALRRKPRAAVRVAAGIVAEGEAEAFFSAGNTGATMLAAHGAFGRLAGVDRPALATTIPTVGHGAVLLDSGANLECRAQHLLQFAAMGTAYARVVLGVPEPKVGLLSIGEEETKGNELTREAHQLLSGSRLRFIGNVEARDLYRGLAEVIVCDGFTGNIALKVSEGLVEVVEEFLRDEFNRTFSTRVGYLLSRRAFRRFRRAGRLLRGWRRSTARVVRPLHRRSRALFGQSGAEPRWRWPSASRRGRCSRGSRVNCRPRQRFMPRHLPRMMMWHGCVS